MEPLSAGLGTAGPPLACVAVCPTRNVTEMDVGQSWVVGPRGDMFHGRSETHGRRWGDCGQNGHR